MADQRTVDQGADVVVKPVEPEAQEESAGLSADERERVREARPPRAAVVYEIIRTKGDTELKRPVSALWWSGVAAGISIGLSFLTEAVLAAHLPPSEWTPLIAKLGYAVGFLVVILGHQQLFTENVLTAVLPVISRKSFVWFLRMLRLWGLVLAANIVGCAIFALFLAKMPIVDAKSAHALAEVVGRLMANTPYEMFAKGIGAGWLIAALVWILSSTEGTDFLIVTLITYLIALFGLTHIVAGTAEVIYGHLQGIVTVDDGIFRFFLPTLAGNVCGGTVLFSVLSYAQVREEIYLADWD